MAGDDLRRARAPGLVLALAGLAGCSWVGLPTPAMPGSGNQGMADLLRDRVWIDEGADAPEGTLRAFLSDGSLVMTSCVETYRLAPWRWVSDGKVVWEEDGANVRAEVVMIEKDTLVLAIDAGGGAVDTRTYRAAKSPVVCPDLPR